MTSIDDLQECIDSVYPFFLLNVIFAGLTGMLRGPIYALGLMRKLTVWNVFFQAIVMPTTLYILVFKLKWGMSGIWLSKVFAESGLLVSYAFKITMADWYKISYDFMKKRVRDSVVVPPRQNDNITKSKGRSTTKTKSESQDMSNDLEHSDSMRLRSSKRQFNRGHRI